MWACRYSVCANVWLIDYACCLSSIPWAYCLYTIKKQWDIDPVHKCNRKNTQYVHKTHKGKEGLGFRLCVLVFWVCVAVLHGVCAMRWGYLLSLGCYLEVRLCYIECGSSIMRSKMETRKRWTSGVVRPTPWAFVCKNCKQVVPIAKRSDGPGFYCVKCGGYTVA